MAGSATVFITLTLMFLEAHSKPNLLGNNGDSSGTLQVGQFGREFYIMESHNIVLPCDIKISASHIVDHGWLKGSEPIPDFRINYSTLDLRLENVTPVDEGEYRCFVKTGVGVLLGPIHTIISPELTQTSEDLHIHGFLNQSIVLPCPIKSVPSGEVRWTTSENLPPQSPNYKQLRSGSLLVLSLRHTDAHPFYCIVRNTILREEIQISVSLTVSENRTAFGPFILDTFTDNVTLSSETEKFYCIGIGNPHPITTWILSYTLLDDTFLNHPQTDHTSFGNELWLNKRNGSSRYDCVASVGSEQISKSMDTHAPPSFPNLSTLKYPAAKTVRFECKPTTTSLIWYKNGELLLTNIGRVKARNNELVISNTVQSDSGFYQCESSKYLGTGRLIIESSQERLSPPGEVVCASSSSKSIRINWKTRLDENILAFTVHYTPAEGGEEKQQVTNNTRISLEWLKPKTNYSIYVRAYSLKSASGQSERLFCSTMDDIAPQPSKPTSLGFYVLGNNSVRITWDTPTVGSGNILSYVVEVTNTSNQRNESSIIMTNNTSVTLDNLVENTNYFVRVLAETSGGTLPGEYSSTIVFRISNNQNQSLNMNTSTSSITLQDEKEVFLTLHPNSTTNNDFLGSEKNIGLILGVTLGVVCIIICGTIIICRNRCFSFLIRRGQRSRRGSYVSTGNSGKDTVDSAPLEMKVLTTHLDVQEEYLDTKGGHPLPNGDLLDGTSDPLVSGNDRERVDDENGEMCS